MVELQFHTGHLSILLMKSRNSCNFAPPNSLREILANSSNRVCAASKSNFLILKDINFIYVICRNKQFVRSVLEIVSQIMISTSQTCLSYTIDFFLEQNNLFVCFFCSSLLVMELVLQGYLAQVLSFQFQHSVVAIDACSHHGKVMNARAERIKKHYAAQMRKFGYYGISLLISYT